MYALTSTTNLDPEALLYDAFATIGMVGKILTTPNELAYLEAHPIDAGIVITAAQAAIPNFQLGLTETRGEARSLNGAFHVFEAHFAQQFAQAIASFGAPGAVENLNTSPHAADTSQQSWLAVPEHAPSLPGAPDTDVNTLRVAFLGYSQAQANSSRAETPAQRGFAPSR
jgi:hypothetical protein